MPVTLKLQDAPHGRRYHLTIRLLADGPHSVLCDYAPWRDDEHLTPAGRTILHAAGSVPGVDNLNLGRYDFDVYPADAFDAATVHADVVDAIRAAVTDLGDTLEVGHLPPIPPPPAADSKIFEVPWPWTT